MNLNIAIADLIPHAGKMCLLDRVTEWNDAMIKISTSSHRDPENPLRSDGRLRAIHLCEYGAQAMAVHGGLRALANGGARARPGLLVSLRDVTLYCDEIDQLEDDLVITANCIQQTHAAWQYDFIAQHALHKIAEGRATVSLLK